MDLDQPAGRSCRWRVFSSQVLLCVLWIAGFSDSAHVEHKTKRAAVDSIEAWQFASLILEFSEQEGFFRSDNFVSNETSYLHVTDALQEIADPGGAYIGVGPEQNRYTVTAFYTSNVEQYLFNNGVFGKFVENVRKLPITNRSLFIRAYPNMRDSHPARIGGHRLTTLLQKVSVFLSDNDEGLYQDYWTLVTTHFIAPGFP